MSTNLSTLKPLTVKERVSMVFIEKGLIDVVDGAFVVIDKTGIRTQIPIGGIACVMLEPGTRVSHSAIALSARVGTLLIWIGEGGVRLYSSGQPGGSRADKLLYQAKLAMDEVARLKVVRKMYWLRFQEEPPAKRSVLQLQGIEGARVKKLYQLIAQKYNIKWTGRSYDDNDWSSGDLPNRCLSSATSCLYGVTEAAVLAAGYSPAMGFIHRGHSRSFIYDIADIFKFETVVPIAFQTAASHPSEPERAVRGACRDIFRKTKLLEKLIPTIEEVLSAGEIPKPQDPEDSIHPPFPEPKAVGT